MKAIKVLKKCKECGIYPSVLFIVGSSYWPQYWEYRCPKCNIDCEGDTVLIAKQEWNKANGFDENDERTWNDEQINDKEKHKQKLRAIAKAFIEYNEHENR